MNQLIIVCHDVSELLFSRTIFKLKSYFFLIRMALKALIAKLLSIKPKRSKHMQPHTGGSAG